MEEQHVDTDMAEGRPAVPLTLTENAASHIRELLATDSTMKALRIKIVGGGCSGYSYDMYLDDEIADDDIVCEGEGVKVVTDEVSLTFIEGTEIDYVKTLTQEGFKFQNPKAENTCGCGISFSA